MVDEQLINWIKQSQSSGYSFEQLKEILLQQGYQEYDVNEALFAVLDSMPRVKNQAVSSVPASVPIKKPETEEEKKKKRKKIWMIAGSAGLLLLLIFLIWVLIPANTETPAPQAPIESPAPAVNTELPSSYSSNVGLTGKVTLIEGSTKEEYTIDMTFDGKNAANNDSYNLVAMKIDSLELEELMDITTEIYRIGTTSYMKIDSPILSQWLKITKDSPKGAMAALGIDPDSFKVFDVSKQNDIVDSAKIEFLDEENKHLRVVASNKVLADSAKLFFTMITTLVPDIKEKYNLDKYTPVYDKAIKNADFEFWLDDQNRLDHGIADIYLQFNKTNLIPAAGYAPVNIDVDMKLNMRASDYGSNVKITVPAEGQSAVSIEDFMSRMISF